MSCGHEFHMRCLVQWLQKPDGTGNCPCCRAEPSENERLVAPAESDDDESDDESEVEDVTEVTPLMEAVRDGNLAEVQRMIAEGINLEEKDSDGDTALVYAAIGDEEACATALIAAGADLTVLAVGDEGVTDKLGAALLAACNYGSLPCIHAALDKGANPNYAHPTSGITPLMEAVRSDGDQALVDLLLAKGASVTAVDSDGWNVFMWFAESSGDIDIMASLLSVAGSAMAPRTQHAAAAKKIQALWRGWKVRRPRFLRLQVTPKWLTVATQNWMMNRMMTVV
jgi:ankyrin repeat protein